ncbi:MAG: tetratricopeptide repeat protein [Candidatus Omnitrophica bacterium]|nr:tetratricopeptide repeat protein [Candidatus Omnitrophota bacterium]
MNFIVWGFTPPSTKKARTLAALVCLAAMGLLFGCSTASKKTEPKELAKLSLDAKEEAQKLRDDGNLQAAAAKYQEALRYSPTPSVHYELGEVLAKLGKTEEARSQFELAIAKNPGMPEAREGLERLEAQMSLAKQSSSGPQALPSTRSSSPSSASSKVTDASGSTGTGAPSGGSKPVPQDVYEEDRLFAEMEKIQPPKGEPDSSMGAIETGDPQTSGADPADTLMADTEALYGRGRGSETSGGDGGRYEEEGFTVPSAGAGARPASKNRALRGGRGLLRGGPSLPAIVVAGQGEEEEPSSPSFPEWGESGDSESAASSISQMDEPTARSGRADQVAMVTGKPGERGWGSTRSRFPESAQILEERTRHTDRQTPKPSLQSGASSAAQTKSAEEEEGSRADKPDRPGLFEEDVITYPERSQPKGSERLPSPYVSDKEELDVRPFHLERLKGRPKRELDLQVCKDRYYKEKDLEGAVRCFTDKKIDFPEEPTLYYELALVLEDAGDYTLARKNLELAMRYDPKNAEYPKTLARLEVGRAKSLRTQGNYPDAVAVLMPLVEKYPDMVEAHRELGRVYAADAVAKEGALAAGASNAGQLEADIKRTWLSSERAYDQVVNLTEGDFKDWYNLGLAIQRQWDDTKRAAAIKAYEKSISLNPEYASAHYHLGILYEGSNVTKALQHYELALGFARRQADGKDLVNRCLASLGELNWRIGNKERAAEYLTEYIQNAPGDATVEEMLNQITSEPL